MLTAIGCPGGIPLIRSLDEHGALIVGVEADPNAIAGRMVDSFYPVSHASSPEYVPQIREVVRRENPDVLIPLSSAECLALAGEDVGARVIGPSKALARITNSKLATYSVLGGLVPLPRYSVVRDMDELWSAMFELGFPNRAVVLRPLCGGGGRGLRVVVPEVHRLRHDWREWPGAVLVGADEIHRDEGLGEPLLVCRWIDGPERSVELYAEEGEIVSGFVKEKHRRVHTGMHTHNIVVEDGELWGYAEGIVAELGFDRCFADIQFLGGKLLEVHPRLSTLVYAGGYNLALIGIKRALGLSVSIPPPPVGAQAQYHWDLCSR